jgi:AmmeMemoRadiSam system protein B
MQLTRQPAVAGMFYERTESALKSHLKELFSGTDKKEGKSRIVVSPHAGYVYSGKTAAHAIASLREADKFIVLGPNHTGMGMEFSIMDSGSWETPLGKCDIDAKLAGKLKSGGSCSFIRDDELSHMQEHSIEVQLPFLQHRFGKFTFVPVCIMNLSYSDEFLSKCEALGKAIAKIMRTESVGLVASSDFSHYLPQDVADMKDEAVAGRILKLDLKGFFRELEEVDASVCGYGPIAVAMAAAKELGLKAKLIHKSSSGDETGDYNAVVAYYAIGFG